MALTQVPIELSSTPGIVDNSNATAITIDANENVGIGVVPASSSSPTWQHIQFGGTGNLVARKSDTTVDAMFASNYYVNASEQDSYITTGAAARMFINDNVISFDQAASGTAGSAISFSEAMRIDSSGNVGIGVTPEAWTVFSPVLQIGRGAIAGSSNTNIRIFSNTYYDGAYKRIATGAVSQYEQADGNHIWYSNPSAAADSTFTPDEHMRIDSSGNVLVGTTDTTLFNNTSGGGIALMGSNRLDVARAGDVVSTFNRMSDDGSIIQFYQAGAVVGNIGSTTSAGGGSRFAIGGNSDPGIIFAGTGVFPASGITASDGSADLGSASYRFKDLYLSGTMVGNLVKLRTDSGSMYVSPTETNTLNGNYDANTDEGDMWINYRGYQNTFNRFRDFRIGNGKGAAIVLVDGSAASVAITGSLSISSSLSKGSGSFKIDHPLPAKTETHHLVHSFVEAPQADNIYRGKVDLVGGSATVNIDTAAGMTEGTYVLLNTNTQCFTSNESGWTAVKGSVSGNTLTITAQDNTCTDTISWMVVGERHDQHMIDTDWTDDNGKVIVEPLKENN